MCLNLSPLMVSYKPQAGQRNTSGGFAYGGWISPHSDPVLSTAIRKQMNMPFDLLVKFQQRYQMRHRKSRDEDALWGFNSAISSF